MSVVDEIKERLDIVEVVSRHVPLKKAGRNFKGLCPFHVEKTPSFVVFPDTGNWHCFGACGIGGDVFSFVMKHDNLDFKEALQVLAPMAGVTLERSSAAADSAEEKLRKRLLAITAAAADYYHQQLLGDLGERARGYLEQRGLTEETWDLFLLGYAPDSWDSLQRYLQGQGYKPTEMETAGLSIARQGGGSYDRFRDRLIIPIRSVRGRPIAFGARLLPGGREVPDRPQPKYLNSPQTKLFDKGREMFGLYDSRQAIRAADSAVIVEGYMDVLAAHQHDIKNVVATMGTALTEQQLKRLKRYTTHFVLALDSDTAGQAATLRGVQQVREALDRTWVPTPTASGLIRFEGRLDAELRIMTLPPGKDPDDVIRADLEQWAQLVANAEPVVDYFLHLVTAELDLSTAKGKAEGVRRLAPLISEVADEVERVHYVQKLARLVQVDEHTIRAQLSRPTRQRSTRRTVPSGEQQGASPQVTARQEGRPRPQDHCLAQLLLQPELLAVLDAKASAVQIEPLEAEDFGDVLDREVFAAVLEAQLSEQSLQEEATRSTLAPPLQERLERLLNYGATLPALDTKQAADDLINVVLRLRLERLRRRVGELQYLLEQAQAEGDGRVGEYANLVVQHTGEIGRLQQAFNARTWEGRRQAS
ncbi:MAG TPA: DNA primase [Anaerolineae bacterium]|nr:DNA primase [Anaerolineae bacterium]